ncbi:DMT family transporter [Paractinoplanes rhizophilus]|jgi:drug/metabolite transporter (DMT)-like permease|uniref:DMT family transporter n=1 Tax=Paractinoplanes rhizophilus TaxID=1416877 RepID=A0ABW2HZW1_9ACTN|nr:DMT family transporter [Actinoplanes sp.]
MADQPVGEPAEEAGPHGRLTVLALVVGIAAILGCNMVALKFALRESDPLTIQALATVVGLMTLVIAARAGRKPLRLPRHTLPGVIGVSMGMTVGSSLGVGLGVQRVSAGVAALLMATTPIITLVLDLVVLRHRHTWHGPVGAFLGLAGVAGIAWGTGQGEVLGVLFMLLGSFGWSVGLLAMKSVQGQVPVTSFLAMQMALGVPVLLLASYLVHGLAANWTLIFVAAVIYSGAMAKGVSFLLQLIVVRHGTALHASLSAFLIPVFAFLAGFAFLGERIRAVELVGAVAILLGVVLVLRSGGRSAEPEPTG